MPSEAAAFPLDWVRSRFPALAGDWVLMDNAGGTAPLAEVADRVADYLRFHPVQLGASYGASATAGELQAAARASLTRLLAAGGGPAPAADELVVGASTTSLLQRLARAMIPGLTEGDEVVVTNVDHEANNTPWRRLAGRGLRIREWRLDRQSLRLEPAALAGLLGERTRLVCFPHASNLLGEALDVRAVTAMAHEAGARVCVDGVAYAPHAALAVKDWDVDYYVFSLYKVFGPHLAVLYGKAEALAGLANINHDFYGIADVPGKLEPGAWPYELLHGATAVPDYLASLGSRLAGGGAPRSDALARAFDGIHAHESALAARLLAFLDGHPAIRVVGSARPGPGRFPTLSFAVPGRRASEITPRVDTAGIGIRWGHFYAPRLVEALGLTEADGVVRASLVHYNTLDEAERLIAALEEALE